MMGEMGEIAEMGEMSEGTGSTKQSPDNMGACKVRKEQGVCLERNRKRLQ